VGSTVGQPHHRRLYEVRRGSSKGSSKGSATKGFRSRALGRRPSLGTALRDSWPINDCLVKKMGHPFLSGRKVPVVATPQFITSPVAMDETSCAKACDETLLGCVGSPQFPSIHPAKVNQWVRQKLSIPVPLFYREHGFGI
jgi:hypothetical protein